METLVETYVEQVLNRKSDISSTGEVVDACKMVVSALNEFRARKRMKS